MLSQYNSFTKAQSKKDSWTLASIRHSILRNNYLSQDFKILKEISHYFSSNSVAPYIDASFNFINGVILASQSLPTSALISIFQNLITTTGCAILGSTNTIVSYAHGQEEIHPTEATVKIQKSFKSGVVLACLLSVPAVIGALSSREILKLMKQPEDLLDDVHQYFVAYAFGIPAIFIVHLQKQVALGLSDIKAVNFLTLFDNTTISSLGYILLYGKFGFPKMGIAGLGYAASITNWLDLILFSAYLKYNPYFKAYELNFSGHFKESLNLIKELLNIGLPIGMQISFELLIGLSYSTLVGKIGADALSAYQIPSQYIMLSSIPALGLSQTASILVGREMGALRIQNAIKYGTICILLGGIISLILLGLMLSITKKLTAPFINIDDEKNKEIITNAGYLFIINGLAQIPDSMRIIAAGAIRSAYRDTRTPTVLGLINFGLVGFLLSCLLGFQTDLGVIGISIGRAIGLTFTCIGLLHYWWLKEKTNILIDAIGKNESLEISEVSEDLSSKIDLSQEFSLASQKLQLTTTAALTYDDAKEDGDSSVSEGNSVRRREPLVFNHFSLIKNDELKVVKTNPRQSRCIIL